MAYKVDPSKQKKHKLSLKLSQEELDKLDTLVALQNSDRSKTLRNLILNSYQLVGQVGGLNVAQ